MKFKFCGDADCPDWVLAEINNLSKLSSVKLKLLAQVVIQGIANPPINMEKAEKLFSDSKLDSTIDLRASISCITYILTQTVRFGCDHGAMHSELQQLGLPREHSTSLKRVIDEHSKEVAEKLKSTTLKVNPLHEIKTTYEQSCNCVRLEINTNEGREKSNVIITPFTLDVIVEELKKVKGTMQELKGTPFGLH